MLGAQTKRKNAPSLLKTHKFETIYALIVTVFSQIISSPKGATQPIDALRLLKARNGRKTALQTSSIQQFLSAATNPLPISAHFKSSHLR